MITILGTGLLGTGFATALLNKGESVNVWNRTHEKTKALEALGAKAFTNVADAARGAERIHLVLSDDKAVDRVLEHASEGFEQNVIIVDHSTTSVQGALYRTGRWKQRGFTYIHAPVFMGPSNAVNANGSMMVCGDQNVIAKLEPALSKMTGKLWNLGEDPGKAAAIKLLGNLFHICFTGAFADVMHLAHSLNIQTNELPQLFEILNPGGIAQARIKKIESNTYDKASWELQMARKDARLMIDQAASTNDELILIPVIAKKMDELIKNGKGQNDWTVLANV